MRKFIKLKTLNWLIVLLVIFSSCDEEPMIYGKIEIVDNEDGTESVYLKNTSTALAITFVVKRTRDYYREPDFSGEIDYSRSDTERTNLYPGESERLTSDNTFESMGRFCKKTYEIVGAVVELD